jgi:hypothetical protein
MCNNSEFFIGLAHMQMFVAKMDEEGWDKLGEISSYAENQFFFFPCLFSTVAFT